MSRKIVAIDDSEYAREVIAATLEEFVYDDVTSYADPLAALAAFSQGEAAADLVLMDIMMPQMNGIELCARLRSLEAWRDVPIVMLTSRTDMDSLSRAFMAGANDYLTKPFEKIEFRARLQSLLRLKSELDRRKSLQAPRARARRTSKGGTTVPGILATRETVLESLAAVPLDRVGKLAVAAFTIDATTYQPSDFGPTEIAGIRDAFAEGMGRVPLPSGDIFAHWEEGTFCWVSALGDAQAVSEQIVTLQVEMQRILTALSVNLQGAPRTLSVGAALPGTFAQASDGLGDAFAALERARKAGGNQIVTSEQDGREPS